MTRYKTIGDNRPIIPSLSDYPGDPKTIIFDFRSKPRTYAQRGIKIGRWFIPLTRWKNA